MKPPPAEWAYHKAVWIGFPSHPELWQDDLEPARTEVVAFARSVHADGAGEKILLVVADDEAALTAHRMAKDFAEIVVEPFGDIWLRDTAPIVMADGSARSFMFNGWGGKYDLPGDETIGERLALRRHKRVVSCDWVLEGGAIDGDGAGTVVTTEQCLLNPNRNPVLTRDEIEARLYEDLGFGHIVWLGEGLHNDHTDGHVDNLARFVGPGRVAIPVGADNDPNWQVYQLAAAAARAAELEVVPVPSPGRVMRGEDIVPASYMNFYIGNAAVVVPMYGAADDAAAVTAFQAIFPDRQVVGLHADHILTGGGSFHCISQQIPG